MHEVNGQRMRSDWASEFIDDNFDPDDRLAIVLIDRHSGSVTQRLAHAHQVSSPEFQAWLRERNGKGADVFVSMNALSEQARGRTRADVASIRHLYLDFDENGTEAIERLQSRQDIPKPNYLVNTSPDHWQVSWKVSGFAKDQAEAAMRELVREFGADPAATDCARVMRVPGFVNHKRHPAHLVRAEHLATKIYTPDDFPRPEQEDRNPMPERSQRSAKARGTRRGHLSQSELDWAYAKRALARGEAPESVVASIADYRRGEKPDPEYYARLTVSKASHDLAETQRPQDGPER